jgi:leader peptidase (prepilin peptidase)/N-methyltransferase
MFPLLYWYYGISGELAVVTFYFCLFLVILVIDLEHHLILNKIVYPGAVTAIIFSIFLPGLEVVPGIASAAAGGGIGLGIFLLIVLLSRGGMGWGDVKMAAFIGLVLGYPLVFVALLLAVITGGLVAALMLMLRVKSRKQSIAFGPFLSLGTMVTLLWGADMLDWYLGLF